MGSRAYRYPTPDDVHAIHTQVISSDPVDRKHPNLMRRGQSTLEGILDRCRPSENPDEEDLFRSAACLALGINRMHPYDAGNKRTALVTAMSFLKENGWEVTPPDDEAHRFMLRLREEHLSVENVDEWLPGWAKKEKL